MSLKNIPWKVVAAIAVTIVASVAMLNLAKQQGGGDKMRSPEPQAQLLQSPQTPPPPTTAQLTAPLPVSWQKIAGNNVELWLPPGYQGGKPSQQLEETLKDLKAINPDYEKVIEAIRLNPNLALAALELQNPQSGFLTNVNVLPEKVSPGTRVEQYLQAVAQEISTEYKILDQKVVLLERHQAARLVTQITAGNTKVKQLIYAIPKGDTFWLVTYSTKAEEFEQRLPTFEKSVRSFTVKF